MLYDVFSRFHNKINLRKIVGGYQPIVPIVEKRDTKRIRAHRRMRRLETVNLLTGQREVWERSLPEFKTVLELSTRTPLCPVPFTLDTNTGVCPFSCIYCFTSLTVSSLMTAFYDAPNVLAPRFASVEHVRDYLDEVLSARGVQPYEREGGKHREACCGSISEDKYLKKAASQRVPLRFGTRSEPFIPAERTRGVALEALKVIREHKYPLVINTKSDLLLEPPYFNILGEMADHLVVQVTLIHYDDRWAKAFEPGAPPFSRRFEVLRLLNSSGIRAYPRMEPTMAFFNDGCTFLDEYFDRVVEAGAKSFMGDLYHHTVRAEEIVAMFYSRGFDFDRMWEVTSEYQTLGSYVMEHVMYHAKKRGLKATTFNFHSIPYNDEDVCCQTSEISENFNRYSMVNALRLLVKRRRLSFKEFDEEFYGHELHPGFRERFKRAWNMVEVGWDNPDFMEGAYIIHKDPEDTVWGFDPSLIGERYERVVRAFEGVEG